MLRLKRLSSRAPRILSSRIFFTMEDKPIFLIPSHNPSQRSSNRFLDIYQIGNKAAIEKERARLADEMNRGYFADISEMKQHGAVKFPALEVNYSDGTTLKLPMTSSGNGVDAYKSVVPKATLLCLSFRASSQAMVDSWSVPFLEAFSNSEKIKLYEVSLIDSWLLSLNPIKRLLLRIMKKSKPDGKDNVLQRQIVYSFGDHYYLRKELKILNLLTGYIFLLDNFGRVRWQGFGLATQEELSSLLSCTSLLLEEKRNDIAKAD
ncbi:uncharacterized protein LOC114272076 isoform X4 [Camellia sinensis]|uniref:uncharacterized protein LOC114272076 isoform X4 n=1 Tax=Camellia sinensis TaxID=4442 RepID=UPI00103589F3|nr:uncharacterized protein LOC114272076 isoform X4 [Camellia sinensis]